MINSIKFAAIILFLFSCGTGKQMKGKSADTSATNNSSKEGKIVTIAGNVTQINPYCGGARPTDEMLEELSTPHAYPFKKFHVRKGNKNKSESSILLSFTTDEKGNFSFQLPSGTYSIIQDEQVKALNLNDYKIENIKVDESCLKEWWAKPYYLLEVKEADIKNLKFQFNHRCFITGDAPCREYTGPLPP